MNKMEDGDESPEVLGEQPFLLLQVILIGVLIFGLAVAKLHGLL